MADFLKNFLPEKNNESEWVKSFLLDSIMEGFIVADEKGDIVYCNNLGREIMEKGLFGPIDIVSKNSKQLEYNGVLYEAKYTKLGKEAGFKGTLAKLVDTYGENEKLREVKYLEKELEKSKSFKEAFLSNMSHEIRTPIHAIVGFSELILKENIPASVREQIDMIKNSSYSLLAIINDVLDLSKIESGKMELVCSNYYISYVIRDIEATFSLLASRKGLKFEMHLDKNIPSYINGDKIRIRGTLINLLHNAIKFTNEGRIDFYVNVVEKVNGVVTLKFIIKDTGVGIREENLPRIFDSFSKFEINSDVAVEGRGLGLSIAKGYIDLMEGTIDVKSEYGVGSTFTVTVNQKIIEDSPIDMNIVNARRRPTDEKFKVNDYRVLVVDDNEIDLKVADGLMKSYGLLVDSASGGRESIDMCMDKVYDIIFMDRMMPQVDGVMAMKGIRKISEYYANECKIVALTADAMAGMRKRMIDEGFDDYLSKPLEIHRLEELLKKLVPSDHIYIKPKEMQDIIIEEGNNTAQVRIEEDNSISSLANRLNISDFVLERKIKDCGGTLEDYRKICTIACKHAAAKVNKLKESYAIKDFERYTIEVHAMKSSLSSLGAVELSDMARKQEDAGKNGDFEYIDNNMEDFIVKYQEFIEKLRNCVVEPKEASEAEVNSERSEEFMEEWTAEEISKSCKKIISLVEEYNFGGVYDFLESILALEMGSKTRAVFEELNALMNDMDIEKLNKRLGEYT